MIKPLLEYFTGISKTRVRGSAAFSLFASTIITGIIYAITIVVSGNIGEKTSSVLLVGIGAWGAAAVISIYIFLFVGIWTVTYVLEQSDAEDLYTWVRKLMLGTWEVRYPLKHGQGNDGLADHDPKVTCYMYINEYNKKLEMRFAISSDRIWADRSQIINLIALKNVV